MTYINPSSQIDLSLAGTEFYYLEINPFTFAIYIKGKYMLTITRNPLDKKWINKSKILDITYPSFDNVIDVIKHHEDESKNVRNRT